jgi:membrane protein
MGLRERFSRVIGSVRKHGSQVREEARNRFARIKLEHPLADVLESTARRFSADEMVLHSANFAFSAFLSIFPLILIVASIFGFIFEYNPTVMQTLIDDVTKAVPQLGVVINTVADSLIRWRGLAAVIGVIGLLLSVNRLVFSVRKGFRKIWDMPKPKFFEKFGSGMLGSLLTVLLSIVVFAAAYATSQAISFISDKLGNFFAVLFLLLGVFLTIGMFFLIFAVPYWLIPRPRPGLKPIAWGGMLAGVLTVISTYVMNIYLNSVSKTQAIFGSVGVIVGLLLWLYFAGLMLFLGAELVKVLEDRRSQPRGEQEILPQ